MSEGADKKTHRGLDVDYLKEKIMEDDKEILWRISININGEVTEKWIAEKKGKEHSD